MKKIRILILFALTVIFLEFAVLYTPTSKNDAKQTSAVLTQALPESENFTFIFTSDAQIGASETQADGRNWRELITKAVRYTPDARFIVHAGDQAENGTKAQYDEFFSPTEFQALPIAAVAGNHDSEDMNFQAHLSLPNKGSKLSGNYYFVYGKVIFLCLDSNNTVVEEHESFISSALADNPDANWRIAVFHHSIYSEGSHSDSNKILKLRENLVPIMDQFNIDLALMGHDHTYSRTHPLKNGRLAEGTFKKDGENMCYDGTVYLTSNSSSGSKYYQFNSEYPYPYTAYRSQEEKVSYSKIEVSPTTLKITSYYANEDEPKQFDTFEISGEDSDDVEN